MSCHAHDRVVDALHEFPVAERSPESGAAAPLMSVRNRAAFP
jgi:hypothetical protein